MPRLDFLKCDDIGEPKCLLSDVDMMLRFFLDTGLARITPHGENDVGDDDDSDI